MDFLNGYSTRKALLLCVLSALLLSLGWTETTSIPVFVALVPMLILSSQMGASLRDTLKYALWTYFTFVMWNVYGTWWVCYAAPVGTVVASIVSAWWNTLAITAYHVLSKRAQRPLACLLFLVGWVATEYVYISAPVMSFPWLTLGNALAVDVWMAQWYEYTGVLGGSLWILLINLLVYELLVRRSAQRILSLVLAVAIPITFSLVLYSKYSPQGEFYRNLKRSKVTVVQPVVPCYEKFSGDEGDQQDLLMQMMQTAPEDADFIVMPETSLREYIQEHQIGYSPVLHRICDSLRNQHRRAAVIAGCETIKRYGTTRVTSTARPLGQEWLDVFNASVSIDSLYNVCIHHKTRLVIGVETLPAWLRNIRFGEVDLGGTFGQLGIGDRSRIFTYGGVRVCGAICYEGMYGESMIGFTRKDAQALFVVSNDGWWENTPGHRYLFAYCRLRAIETRRDIARSANTGVSGFINMRGDDLERLEWNQRGLLTADVALSKQHTVYTCYGDWLGRLSWLLSGLCLLYFIAYRAKKKNYLVD